MSLGWATIPKDEWDGIKTRPGQDRVDPGDYECVPEQIRDIEPKSEGGVGVLIVGLRTTAEGNEEKWAGKQLDYRMNYCPDPNQAPEGKDYAKMNEIGKQDCKALIEAAGVEEQLDADGNVDVMATLNVMIQAQPRIIVRVTHSEADYQEVDNPRPAV